MPGKFSTDLDSAIYSVSLDGGADEEVGSSTEAPGTWAGLVRGGTEIAQAIESEPDTHGSVDPDDLHRLRTEGAAGAIIYEHTDGSVDVVLFSEADTLAQAWSETEAELALDEEEDEYAENARFLAGDQVIDRRSGRAGRVVRSHDDAVEVTWDEGGTDRMRPAEIRRLRGYSPNARPAGRTQEAILSYLQRTPGARAPLTEMARDRAFVGVHFDSLMNSARSLANKGLIEMRSEGPDAGYVLSLPTGAYFANPDQLKLRQGLLDLAEDCGARDVHANWWFEKLGHIEGKADPEQFDCIAAAFREHYPGGDANYDAGLRTFYLYPPGSPELRPNARLRQGDMARIEEGDFAGHVGMVEGLDDGTARVRVEPAGTLAEIPVSSIKDPLSPNPETPEGFEEALQEWLRRTQQMIDDYYAEHYPRQGKKLSLMRGRRYVRVVEESTMNGRTGMGRSVYVFIDTRNGDVLKPASWKGPAKHARGNIFTEQLGVGPHAAHYLRNQQRGRLTERGIEPTERGIYLAPDTKYYMGASTSPESIVVTRVTPGVIHYYHPYAWGEAPGAERERRIDRWIGEDLIMQGTRTWLETYGKHRPDEAAEYEAMLRGEPGGPATHVEPGDYDRLRVTVAPTGPEEDLDLWRLAERYGNVGGRTTPRGDVLEVEGFRSSVMQIADDPAFKIVDVTEL